MEKDTSDINTQIDALKHLSDVHRNQFDERRRFEWKIFFSTIGFYGLTISVKFGTEVKLPFFEHAKTTVWVILLFIAICSSHMLRKMHKKNEINKKFAEQAELEIIKIITHDTGITYKYDDLEKKYKKGNRLLYELTFWSGNWQMLMLFMFALLAAYLITTN